MSKGPTPIQAPGPVMTIQASTLPPAALAVPAQDRIDSSSSSSAGGGGGGGMTGAAAARKRKTREEIEGTAKKQGAKAGG